LECSVVSQCLCVVIMFESWYNAWILIYCSGVDASFGCWYIVWSYWCIVQVFWLCWCIVWVFIKWLGFDAYILFWFNFWYRCNNQVLLPSSGVKEMFGCRCKVWAFMQCSVIDTMFGYCWVLFGRSCKR